MNKTLIRSNAKVNLSLNVLGRKKNGFHNIQSIYSFLDYHDEIYIRAIKESKHRIKFKGKFSKNIKNNSVSQLLKILDEAGADSKPLEYDAMRIKKLIGDDHKDFLEFILAVLYKLAYSDHVYSEEEERDIRKVAKIFNK